MITTPALPHVAVGNHPPVLWNHLFGPAVDDDRAELFAANMARWRVASHPNRSVQHEGNATI